MIRLAAILMLLALPAAAHGNFNWIMQSTKFGWCCGVIDCATIPSKSVKQTATGWTFQRNGRGYRVPFEGKGIYISKDHHFHACFNDGGKGSLRCFFHPVGAV